jgi:hypothetical protein
MENKREKNKKNKNKNKNKEDNDRNDICNETTAMIKSLKDLLVNLRNVSFFFILGQKRKGTD